MADVQIAEGMVEVRLAVWERLFALHGNVIVPVSAVREIFIVSRPFAELRGLRWPGTWLPNVVALGTWRYEGGKDFVAIYGQQGAVEIDLVGCEFARLLIGTPIPESVVDRLVRVR